jgi:hypothetical protein
MSKKFFFQLWFLLLVFLLVFPLAACVRQSSLVNVYDAPVTWTGGSSPATAKVKNAILAACMSRGWEAREVRPGLISASLSARGKHTAVVEIPFSGTSYSIIYKDSVNLRYNAAKQTIHSQYNTWIHNLRHDINVRLAQL